MKIGVDAPYSKWSEIGSLKTINYNSTLVFQMCCRVSSVFEMPHSDKQSRSSCQDVASILKPFWCDLFLPRPQWLYSCLTDPNAWRQTDLYTITLLSDNSTESTTAHAWMHVCSRNNAVLSCCGAALWMKIVDHAASSNTASKVCTKNKFIVAQFVPRNILRSFRIKRMRSRNFIALSLQVLYVSQRKAFHKHKAIIWYYGCSYAYVPSSAPNIQLDPGS